MSVPLVKGDRVGTELRCWHGVWCVVQVCFEDYYVPKDVRESSVEPCLVEFCWEEFGGGLKT